LESKFFKKKYFFFLSEFLKKKNYFLILGGVMQNLEMFFLVFSYIMKNKLKNNFLIGKKVGG
jgi:hypothetical protein